MELVLKRFPQFKLDLLLQGGDVVQETISANASDDTITLEFQRSDGTLVTQLIDFRNVSRNNSIKKS